MGKTKGKVESSGPKSIHNRKARFEYEIFEEFEAGIVLIGSEVKSLFNGKGNLTDSYCRVLNSEVWVIQLDIENYTHTSAYQPERRRDRKLLLHRSEIEVIDRKVREKGYSLIPLDVYFKNGKAKLCTISVKLWPKKILGVKWRELGQANSNLLTQQNL